MPLSRELCEALRVLPEVRGRARGASVDAWWVCLRSETEWQKPLWACHLYANFTVAGRAAPGPWLWCPSLSDLLALAHRRVGTGSLRMESHPTWWECGHADGDGRPVFVTAGDTPEEAVAAWLLAHAKEGASR